jgi:hypothetical protein
MPRKNPTIAIAAISFLTGCASLMPAGMLNMTAASADNPLGGTPVAWERESPGLPFEGQKACTTWPIKDTLKVKATDTEVCVDGEVYKLVAANFDGPTEASLQVESDGSGEEGLGMGQTDHVKASTPKKVGTCFDKSANQEKTVWVAAYSSCVPNKNVSGKQVLTTKSTFLQVGEARWKFPTAAAPAAAATPASGS